MVERFISNEAIKVQDLETTIRGTKGFRSSDTRVTKQVGTVPDCLVSSPGRLQDDQTPKAATIHIQKEAESSLNQTTRKSCQQVPRTQTMTKQVSACGKLLSKPPWNVTGPSDIDKSYKQHPKMAGRSLNEPPQDTLKGQPSQKQ